ncbi:MAG: transglutaminase domain-containing protein [Bacilli bacterium]|nr:transglutaminase domain-containing protein [Bacilli bacterium]
MNIQELKDAIDNFPNKQVFMAQPTFYQGEDIFAVLSAKYENIIYCPQIQCVNDIYSFMEKYSLNDAPFAIEVLLIDYNEKSLDIINSLDKKIFIRIIPTRGITKDEISFFEKINHPNCIIDLSKDRISVQCLAFISNNFIIDEKSPVVSFDMFNYDMMDSFGSFYQKFPNLICIIDINDPQSLEVFNTLLNMYPECDWRVRLTTDLFDRRNQYNARDLLVQDLTWPELQNEKAGIMYLGIEYKNMEEVFKLERLVELIKSRIPADASDLDIVTYISLFIINYFKYDKKTGKITPDINTTQFISLGKGVCRHFSEFTRYILNSLGIKCRNVHAPSYKNPNSWHAFNVVVLDGKEYFLDNTWLAEKAQAYMVSSLSEASDFLTSMEKFNHNEYYDTVRLYLCEQYDRQEIAKSEDRVLDWGPNYVIHRSALQDLFRKYILKKPQSVEEKIEDAIPRRW